MKRVSNIYLYAVDAVAEVSQVNNPSGIPARRSDMALIVHACSSHHIAIVRAILRLGEVEAVLGYATQSLHRSILPAKCVLDARTTYC